MSTVDESRRKQTFFGQFLESYIVKTFLEGIFYQSVKIILKIKNKTTTTLLSHIDRSWTHVEKKKGKKKKVSEKRTHTVWLHSYKVQKLVKLIYDVRSPARSSIWREGYWGDSDVQLTHWAVLTCSIFKCSPSCRFTICVLFYVYVVPQ